MTDSPLQRLTQPDWCNAPQPNNWANACMRLPDHTGNHAHRKHYRPSEAFVWNHTRIVTSLPSARFQDLWDVEDPADRMLADDAWAM